MIRNTIKKISPIVFGPMLATAIGLAVVLLTGLASWQLARGVPGILIGVVVSVSIAWLIRTKAGWSVSLFASGFGAMVACFLAISTAEILPPGSIEWMFKGGLYGAAFGVPVAAILSPLALIENRRAKD